MADMFASGRIAEIVLVVVILEGFLLAGYFVRSGRRSAVPPLLCNLASGACLVLALRAALVSDGWGWVAAFLSAALIAHLADLRLRWRA